MDVECFFCKINNFGNMEDSDTIGNDDCDGNDEIIMRMILKSTMTV